MNNGRHFMYCQLIKGVNLKPVSGSVHWVTSRTHRELQSTTPQVQAVSGKHEVHPSLIWIPKYWRSAPDQVKPVLYEVRRGRASLAVPDSSGPALLSALIRDWQLWRLVPSLARRTTFVEQSLGWIIGVGKSAKSASRHGAVNFAWPRDCASSTAVICRRSLWSRGTIWGKLRRRVAFTIWLEGEFATVAVRREKGAFTKPTCFTNKVGQRTGRKIEDFFQFQPAVH